MFDILLPCLPTSWRTALKCGLEADKQPDIQKRSEIATGDEMDISHESLIITAKTSSV